MGSEITYLHQVSQTWKALTDSQWLWQEVLGQEFRDYPGFVEPKTEEKQDGPNIVQLKTAYQTNWKLSMLKTLRWKHHPTDNSVLSAREAHSACLLGDGRVYVFAGFESFGTSNSVYALDPETITWTEIQTPSATPAPPNRYGSTSCTISENSFIIFGGYSMGGYRGSMGDAWIFTKGDGNTGTWKRVPRNNDDDLPTARAYHASCLVPKSKHNKSAQLFIFGGNNEDEPIQALEVLDLATLKWSIPVTNSTVPPARNGCSLNLVKNKLYLMGGGTSENVPRHRNDLFDIHILDLKTMRWHAVINAKICDEGTDVPRTLHENMPGRTRLLRRNTAAHDDIPIGRCHSSEVVGKNIVCFSGGLDYCTKLMRFNTETLCWHTPKTYGKSPHPRQAHVMVRASTKLILYGGWAARVGTFNDVTVLDLTAENVYDDDDPNFEPEETRSNFRTTYDFGPSLGMLLFLQAFQNQVNDDD